jgi:hypothetical protein
MPIVNIIVNQTGKSAGVAGESRDDLSINLLVTLTNNDNTGVTSWEWEIIAWPQTAPGDAAPVLAGTTTNTATFTPTIRGTYVIQLIVNDRIKDRIGAAIKTQTSSVRIPSYLEGPEFIGGWGWAASHALATMDSFIAGGGAPSGPASGDLTDDYPGPVVAGLRGRVISTTAPTDNQILVWNDGISEWQPQTPSTGSSTFLALTDTPSSYIASRIVAVNGAATGLEFVTTAPPGGSASGDLSGTYPGPTVAKLQGNSVSSNAPSDGQVLAWSSGGSNWVPSSVVSTFLGLTDAPSTYVGQAGMLIKVNVGETALEFFNTASGDLSGTYPNPFVSGLQGRSVYDGAPSDLNVLAWSVSNQYWYPLTNAFTNLSDTPSDYTGYDGCVVAVNIGATALEFVEAPPPGGAASGDLGDNYPNPIVVGLYNHPLDPTVVIEDGNVLTWNSSDGYWKVSSTTGGVSAFIDLTDAPITYADSAGAILIVNDGPDGIEFLSGANDGELLQWDEKGGGGWTVVAGRIDDLSNVLITEPSEGEVLTYDDKNAVWYNAPPSGSGTLDRYLVFSDDTEFTEADTPYAIKKTFRIIRDSGKKPMAWRLVCSLWTVGGTSASCKLNIVGSGSADSGEVTSTATTEGNYANSIKSVDVTPVEDNEREDTILTVTIQLKQTGGGVAHIKYTDLFAIFV